MSDLKNIEAKVDEILNHLSSEAKRQEERFTTLSNKLDYIEKRTSTSEQQIVLIEKKAENVTSALIELEADVNLLQQEKLNKNCLINGIPEKETTHNELMALLSQIIAILNVQNSEDSVLYCGRTGKVSDTKNRSILVKFKTAEAKDLIMSAKKKKAITCDMFLRANSSTWGTAKDEIFFSDHMTPTSSKLNIEAKKLRSAKLIQDVWTVNGVTYVRRARGDKSIMITSLEDIQSVADGLPRRSRRRKLLSPEKALPESKRDKQNSK